MTNRQHTIIAAVALLVAVWEFGGLVHAGFVYQDYRWQIALESSSGHLLFIPSRFLMRLSWWLQSRYTPSATSFHIVNLGMHLTVSLLVVKLARTIGLSPFASWIAFIVFAFNPIQMETVAYLSGRTEMLAALGVLIACILLAGEVTPLRILAASAATAFGLLGKESAIVVIALVPIVRRDWPLVPITLLAVATIAFIEGYHQVEGFYRTMGYTGGLLNWVATQLTAEMRVLFTTVTTVGSTVYFDYSDTPIYIKAMATIAACQAAWLGWSLRYIRPVSAIGILMVVAVWVPRAFVLTPGANFSEHQFYLGVAGVALVFADLASYLSHRFDQMWRASYEMA